MIFDLKYHIASLTAVFLALGIGILVGTTVIGNDALTKQQERLVASLQEEFKALREDNEKTTAALAELQADLAYQQEFNRAVLPVLVKERLKGRAVAVVDVNYRRSHDALANVLRLAGAEVRSVTSISLPPREARTVREVAALLGLKGEPSYERVLRELAVRLAATLQGGGEDSLLRELEALGVVKVSGSYGQPLSDVIVIGGAQARDRDCAKVFDLALIKMLTASGVRVFGVEDARVPVSYMRYYQGACLATVDNIDTVYGQVALVRAMEGYPGRYGVKESAEKFLPPLE